MTLNPQTTVAVDTIFNDVYTVDTSSDVVNFYWKNLLSEGFEVRIRFNNPNDQVFNELLQDYFKNSKPGPYKMNFRVRYRDSDVSTPWSFCYITACRIIGPRSNYSEVEFIGVDPVTWWLNNGTVSGRAYKGTIGGRKGVIAQYCNELFADDDSISVDITDSKDSPNIYYPMRLSPSEFVDSLLYWSSSFTPQATAWTKNVISTNSGSNNSGDVKYVFDVSDHAGSSSFNAVAQIDYDAGDVYDWSCLAHNFIFNASSGIMSSGISAATGTYYDKVNKSQDTIINDQNTENKINVEFKQNRGFIFDPSFDGVSRISRTIPEFNDGKLGDFGQYISGVARNEYIKVKDESLMIRLRLRGSAVFDDTLGLITDGIYISKTGDDAGLDNNDFFLNGKWLLAGWHHMIKSHIWYTDIYAYRLNQNANAQRI